MDVEEIFTRFKEVSVAVVGDVCIDAYLILDENRSEVSVETGLKTRSAMEIRFELGGAANIAKNLSVLGVGNVSVFGIRGDDVFGREMARQFDLLGIDNRNLILQKTDWCTNAYVKPYNDCREESRIDIGNFNVPDKEISEEILSSIEEAIKTVDVIIINQQLLSGINTEWFRRKISEMIIKNKDTIFIADSRTYSDEYCGADRKINLIEAAHVLGLSLVKPVDDVMVRKISNTLYERWGQTVLVTMGDRGIAVRSSDYFEIINGIKTSLKTDPVGAGDALIAGVAACVASGIGYREAARFGNYCAAVTVNQCFTAGSPYPDDIIKISRNPDCLYNPVPENGY